VLFVACGFNRRAAEGRRSPAAELLPVMLQNTLFYGDTLAVLQKHILDASVDLHPQRPPHGFHGVLAQVGFRQATNAIAKAS